MTLLLGLDTLITGNPMSTALFIAMCVSGSVMLLGLGYQLVPARRHKRVYVDPLYWVMNNEFRVPHYSFGEVRTGLVHVPRDFRDNHESLVQVKLPPRGCMSPRVLGTSSWTSCGSSLRMPDAEPTLHWAGRQPYATFKTKPRPPTRVLWRDVADVAEDGSPPRPRCLSGSVPATLPCASTWRTTPRTSAAVPCRAVASQRSCRCSARRSWRWAPKSVIIDPKLISHLWADNPATGHRLPGVRYCRESREIYRILRELVRSLLDRQQRVLRGEDPGRPLFVLIDEMNLVRMRLNQFWREELEGRGPNPATGWILELLCAGATLKIHLICAGQRLSAKTFGDFYRTLGRTSARSCSRSGRRAPGTCSRETSDPSPRRRTSRVAGRSSRVARLTRPRSR